MIALPKPKGWSTKMIEKRDKIAEALIKKGYSEQSAYAIATWRVEHGRKVNSSRK